VRQLPLLLLLLSLLLGQAPICGAAGSIGSTTRQDAVPAGCKRVDVFGQDPPSGSQWDLAHVGAANITALEVSPSSGVLYAAVTTDVGGGAIFVYLGARELVQLPLDYGNQNTDLQFHTNFALQPVAISLMEVGNANLFIAVASSREQESTSDAIQLFKIEEPLGVPTKLTYHHTVKTTANLGRVEGMWAAWPRGIYVASCTHRRPSSVVATTSNENQGVCSLLFCYSDSPDWRYEAEHEPVSHERPYDCHTVFETRSRNLRLKGVAASPLFHSIYTAAVGEREANSDGSAVGPPVLRVMGFGCD
jgi:hypothetical protein